MEERLKLGKESIKVRKVMTKTATLLMGAFIVQALCPENAFAWGPAVHTVIALSVLDGISEILPQIGALISAKPIEYIYGSLAADFFIGKTRRWATKHIHNWDGGFRLLKEAKTRPQQAYAYGFLSHLAADVVAHNLFVPNMMSLLSRPRRVGHLYWEAKADYLMGPTYLRVAKGVLFMNHEVCDKLLKSVTGKRNGLKAKKRIFTQTVKFSDYIYGAYPEFFNRKPLSASGFANQVFTMVSLSSKLVLDFLKDPVSCPCTTCDPLGKKAMEAVSWRGMVFGFFRARSAPRALRPGRNPLSP